MIVSDEYTEEEKKITGNFMYGGKRHDVICDYFEAQGYSEKEINDISMGIWKGIESEKLVSEKKLEKLQAELQVTREQLEKAENVLKMYASRNNWNSSKEAIMLCEYVGGETARQYFLDKDKE